MDTNKNKSLVLEFFTVGSEINGESLKHNCEYS